MSYIIFESAGLLISYKVAFLKRLATSVSPVIISFLKPQMFPKNVSISGTEGYDNDHSPVGDRSASLLRNSTEHVNISTMFVL